MRAASGIADWNRGEDAANWLAGMACERSAISFALWRVELLREWRIEAVSRPRCADEPMSRRGSFLDERADQNLTTQTPMSRGPSRAILGGLSLLLVVAFAFQATGQPGLKASGGQTREAVARMVVETMARTEARQVRRQSERPEAAPVELRARSARRVEARVSARGLVACVRMPGVFETSLPPPQVG
jgi:hypothetical protein